MRKLIYIFLFLIGLSPFSIQAQCLIDTSNHDLISPGPDDLPCIERNTAFSTVLQFYAPTELGGVYVDSLHVDAFYGFPNGITAECNPANCTLLAGEHGCLWIHGTTTDPTGTYPLQYSGTAYTTTGAVPFSLLQSQNVLPTYSFILVPQGYNCSPTSIRETRSESAFQFFPSERRGQFVLAMSGNRSSSSRLCIFAMDGTCVLNTAISAAEQRLSIDLSSLPAGIYCAVLNSGSNQAASKFIIE